MVSSATFTPAQAIQWQPQGHKQRLFSMFTAAFMTLCLVAFFNFHPKNQHTNINLTTPLTLFLLKNPINTTPHAKPIAPEAIRAQTLPRNKPSLSSRKSSRTSEKEAPVLTQNEIISNAPQAISPPPTLLQWDSKSINKAYNDSKSEIQKMAERSGKEMNTPIKTKYEKFQAAAEQAATPDCLSPQSGGLGLLSIPVIIVAAATDKCKMP